MVRRIHLSLDHVFIHMKYSSQKKVLNLNKCSVNWFLTLLFLSLLCVCVCCYNFCLGQGMAVERLIELVTHKVVFTEICMHLNYPRVQASRVM